MDELIDFDQHLLLVLNGSDNIWLDNVFQLLTKTVTWVPLILVLLYILLKNRPWREVLLFVVCLALVILVTDRFSSGFCKPFFHRFRPSHEPALEGLVDLVGDRRGGLYGFISSHAANTFGAFAFISLYFRRRAMTLTLFLWACLSSYSRIYLGLHYPGDILVGALWGLLTGTFVYFGMTKITGYLSKGKGLLPVFSADESNCLGCQEGRTECSVWTGSGGESVSLTLFPVAFVLTLLVVMLLAQLLVWS